MASGKQKYRVVTQAGEVVVSGESMSYSPKEHTLTIYSGHNSMTPAIFHASNYIYWEKIDE